MEIYLHLIYEAYFKLSIGVYVISRHGKDNSATFDGVLRVSNKWACLTQFSTAFDGILKKKK